MSPPASRSLAQTLRGWDDERLGQLLLRRPDLVVPVPADLAELARRVSGPGSVSRALDRLDATSRQVAEAVVALTAPTSEPVSTPELAQAMGCEPDELTPVLAELAADALVYDLDGRWLPVGAVSEAFGPHPCGLDRVDRSQRPGIARILADPDHLDEMLGSAPAPARAAVDRLTWGPPNGTLPTGSDGSVDPDSPLSWLIARDLLVLTGPGRVVLPREVAWLLRHRRVVPALVREPDPTGPVPDGPGARLLYTPDRAEATAGMNALATVRVTADVVDQIDHRRPRVMRGGGLTQRDLSEIGRVAGESIEVVTLALDLARASGLIDVDEHDQWTPTRLFDRWRAAAEHRQWGVLVAAWWTSGALAAKVGRPDDAGTRANALSDSLRQPGLVEIKHHAVLGGLRCPPDRPLQADALAAWVRWRRPRVGVVDVDSLVGDLLVETELLGLTGNGLPTAGLRCLAEDTEAAAAELAERLATAIEPHLPELVERLVIQSDLTATAPGPLSRQALDDIARLARRESGGAAAVFRFDVERVRRALDHGHHVDDLLQMLHARSLTGVPDPVVELIADQGRRHGRVTVQAARTVIRSDDEAAVAAILADTRLVHLGIHRVGPGVLAAQGEADEVLRALQQTDHPAVGDSARSSGPSRAPAPDAASVLRVDPAMVSAAVRALRAGDRSGPDGGAGPGRLSPMTPAALTDLIQSAISGSHPLWITYADNTGVRATRLVDPLTLRSGSLVGFDHREQRVRAFTLSRIGAAGAAERSEP